MLCNFSKTIIKGIFSHSFQSETTISQRIWIIQYSIGQISQLFLYCWHSNEFAAKTRDLDRGVYESDWTKGDVFLRRQILLLAGKLSQTLILNAGPYASLSIPTFITIMKGTYSFYTLFSQMQDSE
ncbi:odorant receptor 46a-like [Bombyx mandarina]|uniref:Odorant receptor 46a-like n=1 Tax=Bombyx mandarina TaxID=7092 RepID=A0A6J2J778_BOMMA|nr:odorant receptor 46a-like [Bombyx mandarina]